MSTQQSRRSFLKLAAGSVAAATASRLSAADGPASAPTSAPAPEKLRVAVIGCGGQGVAFHIPNAVRERLVAVVDPDPKRIGVALKAAAKANENFDPAGVRTFDDYRKLFDAMSKDLDAVLIATPNHHHALPAMIAMKHRIGCYVEKPLTYCIDEARTLARMSKEYGVASQMGNQGHSGEGYRRLCEYIWAGAIGKVREVYCWTDRANGGVGPRPETLPVPEGMTWDSWIGPAPYRDYHKDLHPHEWHGWHDFGDGSLGNMGCHILDGAHWALKLGDPSTIEVEEMTGGTDERYPLGTRIRWDYPARYGMPPVRVYWYDGLRRDATDMGQAENQGGVGRQSRNRPPLVSELEEKTGRSFGASGSIYVGDKGIMFTNEYGGGVRIVPEEQHKATPVPEQVLPRLKGGHHDDFFKAIRTGQPACSNFEISSKLAEMVLLGCLAIKAGQGRRLEWDGAGMKVVNLPEINRYLQRDYRKGWEA